MHVLQLLLQIAAIVLVGRLFGLLFRRIGQPSVIAEIVAGIALGPSLLGAVSPDGMKALFPADTLPILGAVSQLGLVLFMFLVGLEFDTRLLRGQGRASVAISASGIVLPFVLGAALSVPLHARLAPEGVPLLSFSLFLGVAMSVTAFPVLARILTERRLIRTKIGAVALAAAAVDDVTAWCLLAAVVAVARTSGAVPVAQTILLSVVYVLVMLKGVRPMLARLGPRGGAALSADLVAFLFLLLLASAAATEWIGIHALFGAFCFGVIVPRRHGLGAVLLEKLEDLVTLLLLPTFFAYSGLRTQIGLLSSWSDWGTAAFIIAVATIGKFGGTSIAARLTGLDGRTASAVGILMNTRGLMELVVLNIGLDLGVISPSLFAMMVVMALVTTLATSPLLEAIFPAAAMLAAETRKDPTRPEPGVLLCVSDPATAAALVRVAQAWTRRGGATVWALHLTPTERMSETFGLSGPDHPLEAAEAAAREAGLALQPMAFPTADPAGDIVRIAAVKEVPLLILGGHRSPLAARETLGGATGAVLAGAECDVGVLVARGNTPIRRVGVLGADAAVRRVASRLVTEGDVELVDGATTGVDLVLTPASAPVAVPEGGPSWLFVGGR